MSTTTSSELYKRLQRGLTASNVLSFSWFALLWWGEEYVYKRAISRYQWHKWEKWSSTSTRPYRIALIADPQLVDENTYQRRGILLRLSQFYTDLYMKRNWLFIHKILHPKMTIFLGDLMDGGREWDDIAWEKEYRRFREVFRETTATPYIASLPGNHDIGVSDTVSHIAFTRFKKHFGEPSSEFRAGDFTLILLDTVSLSAEYQRTISQQPQIFLDSLRSPEPTEPRILLTHIPLYRPEGTPCGPLRESKNPIRVGKGYQYQNVLTPELSKRVVDIVRPLAVFSGDDHDYCYVQHNYAGMKIPEHTVKSFSWAMGVNNPGFQLLSLSSSESYVPTTPEFSSTPCILPNQLHIFIIYGIALFITIVSVLVTNWLGRKSKESLLPTTMERHNNDDSNNKHWKPSNASKHSIPNYILSCIKDLQKIGFFAITWYLWLIWY